LSGVGVGFGVGFGVGSSFGIDPEFHHHVLCSVYCAYNVIFSNTGILLKSYSV
jgi:hypothetical protein